MKLKNTFIILPFTLFFITNSIAQSTCVGQNQKEKEYQKYCGPNTCFKENGVGAGMCEPAASNKSIEKPSARSNQTAASNGVIAEDETQARDSPYCEKMKNWASGSIELLAESLGESMSSISLIRFRKGDLSCLAVVDTPKGPVNCVVQKIRKDGKQVYADLESFIGGAVCSVLRTGQPNPFVH